MEAFELMRERLLEALSRLESYDPVLDLPLADEVARSAINLRYGERFLDDPNCTPATYAAVSDAMAKHASRMRGAIKELAASRAERLRLRTLTGLVNEIKAVVDKVIQNECGTGQV